MWKLLKKIHGDEKGAVSIETVLIIAAIALPILIFIVTVAWPRMKAWWFREWETLEGGAGAVPDGS